MDSLISLHPTKVDCFTPRAASYFVKKWLKYNSPEYDYWNTPKGPILFKKLEHGYSVKDPITNRWVEVADMKHFIEQSSESLAICFGWKKGTK